MKKGRIESEHPGLQTQAESPPHVLSQCSRVGCEYRLWGKWLGSPLHCPPHPRSSLPLPW